MREFDRIGLQVTGEEVVGKRAPTSKTFDLGNGQFNLQQTMGLIHYDNNGLDDIDLEPEDAGDFWVVNKAPYTLQIAKGTPQIFFTDKKGLEISLSLASLDGEDVPVLNCLPMAHDNGHALCFENLLGDGHLSIVITPVGIRTEQKIFSDKGIKTLLWNVKQNHPDPIITETSIRAMDANKAKADVSLQRSALTQNGGKWEGTFQERFSGNITSLDKKTRVKSSGGAAAYPVTVIS